MNITFTKLTNPAPEIAATLNRWANDPSLIKFIRPSRNKEELEKYVPVTVESLMERLEHVSTYLIHADGHLVGEINFQIDPDHLIKKETGTAWIGIVIGEESARGKGIGTQAMLYLEEKIQPNKIGISYYIIYSLVSACRYFSMRISCHILPFQKVKPSTRPIS